MKKQCFDDIIDGNEQIRQAEREFVVVNEIPHYPISFKSYDHLYDMAELDLTTHHPLGMVFASKGTNSDNTARMVVLNGSYTNKGVLQAFLFDKSHWHNKDNPFAPEFNQPVEKIMIDKITLASRRAKGLFVKMKPLRIIKSTLKFYFQ